MNMQSRERKANAEIEQFNSRYPVGQLCDVKKDDGTVIRTKTVSPAGMIGSTAVCWFADIRGAYMLSRATPV